MDCINQPFLFCFFRACGRRLFLGEGCFLIVVARGGLPRPARAGLAMTFAMSPEQDARVGARKGRGKARTADDVSVEHLVILRDGMLLIIPSFRL